MEKSNAANHGIIYLNRDMISKLPNMSSEASVFLSQHFLLKSGESKRGYLSTLLKYLLLKLGNDRGLLTALDISNTIGYGVLATLSSIPQFEEEDAIIDSNCLPKPSLKPNSTSRILSFLNEFFRFIIWNKEILIIGGDNQSDKPHFYYPYGQSILFTSEIFGDGDLVYIDKYQGKWKVQSESMQLDQETSLFKKRVTTILYDFRIAKSDYFSIITKSEQFPITH